MEKKQCHNNDKYNQTKILNDEKELLALEKYPLFDEEDALQKAGGNRELMNDLLTLLAQVTIPEELLFLTQAREVSDWAKIQKLAHKLKSASLYCGAVRMQYACSNMECYPLSEKEKMINALYEQLVNVLKATQTYIDNKIWH